MPDLCPGLFLSGIAERQPEISNTPFQGIGIFTNFSHVGRCVELFGYTVFRQTDQLSTAS